MHKKSVRSCCHSFLTFSLPSPSWHLKLLGHALVTITVYLVFYSEICLCVLTVQIMKFLYFLDGPRLVLVFGRKRGSCGEILSTITNNRGKTDVTGKQGKCSTLDSVVSDLRDHYFKRQCLFVFGLRIL